MLQEAKLEIRDGICDKVDELVKNDALHNFRDDAEERNWPVISDWKFVTWFKQGGDKMITPFTREWMLQ